MPESSSSSARLSPAFCAGRAVHKPFANRAVQHLHTQQIQTRWRQLVHQLHMLHARFHNVPFVAMTTRYAQASQFWVEP